MTVLKIAQAVLFVPVLIHASAEDVRHHECADVHWLLLLIPAALSLLYLDFMTMLFGLLSAGLPLLICAVIRPGSIGGADIKMAGVFGLLLGFRTAVPGLLLGLLSGIITMTVLRRRTKEKKKEPFALVPFLSFGFCTAFAAGLF